VQNVWHQRLESHILHTCDILCSLEVFRGTVGASFPRVVDEILGFGQNEHNLPASLQAYLGHFAQGSSLFAEIDHNATASLLSFLHSFLDAIYQVWATGANVRAKDIRAIAFIVNAKSQSDLLV